jgi:hypothetical protein
MSDIPPVDRSKQCTTDGRSPADARASQTNETGQHASYVVLCEEERQKGFVRPYRDAYRHVGIGPVCGKPMPRPPDEAAAARNYRCNGEPNHSGGCCSWAPKADLDRKVNGCGSVTTMGRALSETYARDPKFYGATFCCSCNRHLPVNEFVWTADGQIVGS